MKVTWRLSSLLKLGVSSAPPVKAKDRSALSKRQERMVKEQIKLLKRKVEE